MKFSVTCYVVLHNAISFFYCQCKFVPSKDANVRVINNQTTNVTFGVLVETETYNSK